MSRIHQYVQALGVPSPYSTEEIRPERFDVLKWLVYNLRLMCTLQDEQLLLLGQVKGENSGFIRLLKKALKVCFVPRCLNNWEGVDNSREVKILDGIGDSTYSSRAEEESSCRTNLIRLLDGQLGLYEWGSRGEDTFRNEINTPVILVPTLAKIPATLLSKELYSQIRVVEWKSPPFFDVMPMGRMATTLLDAAESCELRYGPIDIDTEFSTFCHISDCNGNDLSYLQILDIY